HSQGHRTSRAAVVLWLGTIGSKRRLDNSGRTPKDNHMWDDLWVNGRLATMTAGGAAYGAIEDGAIAAEGGKIAWVGAQRDLPGRPAQLPAHVHDLARRWLPPGLIDCHTHLVYAGDRAREFELRLQGASYEEIARAGGGIRSTVTLTRAASE